MAKSRKKKQAVPAKRQGADDTQENARKKRGGPSNQVQILRDDPLGTTPQSAADPSAEDVDFERSEDTPVINAYFSLIENGLLQTDPSIEPATYTLPEPDAEHVQRLPLLDPATRKYALLENEVALTPWRQSDGTTVSAWQLKARNLADDSEPVLNLFTLPRIQEWRACSRCLFYGKDPSRQSAAHAGKSHQDRNNIHAACSKKDSWPCEDCKGTEHEEACIDDGMAFAHNWLTESVCSDKDKIIELGRIQVDIMNKCPFDLEIETWTRSLDIPSWKVRVAVKSILPRAREFVETTSILEWKKGSFPELNFDNIPPLMLNRYTTYDFWSSELYKCVSISPHGTAKSWSAKTPCYIWPDAPGHRVQITTHEYLFPTQSDSTKDDNLDNWHTFGRFWTEPFSQKSVAEEAKERPEVHAMLQAVQKALLSMVGLVGSRNSVRKASEVAMAKFQTKPRHKGRRHGSVDGGRMFLTPVYSRPGCTILSFSYNAFRYTGPVITYTADSLSIDRLEADPRGLRWTVVTTIRDSACIAYVFMKAVNAFSEGRSWTWIVFRFLLTIQQIESGMVTRPQIMAELLETFGETSNADEGDWMFCMTCMREFSASSMTWISSTSGPLFCCRGCSTARYACGSVVTDLFHFLLLRSQSLFKQESKHLEPRWTAQEMAEKLLARHTIRGESRRCKDGYSAEPLSIDIFTLHPAGAHLEKPYQQWQGVLHDPDHNITITKAAVNIGLHHTLSVSAVPLAKDAHRLWKEEQGLGPIGQDYHPDLLDEWRRHECAQDHQRIVSTLTHSRTAERLSESRDSQIDVRIKAMEKSGVWDGDIVRKFQEINRLFASKGETQVLSKRYPMTSIWSDERWDEIVRLILQMEADHSTDGMNPEGRMKISWVGSTEDIPWLWTDHHLYEDVDREWLYRQYSADFRTMDEDCDPNHETRESPDTLLLHDVRQFLKDGGRCHIFGFKMTRQVGYLATTSKGRGVVQLMRDGSERDIKPGEHMRTGWTSRAPTSLANFNRNLLTIITESGLANRFRWHWRGGRKLLPQLDTIVEDLYDECEWYDAVKKNIQAVPLPTLYRERRKWLKDFYQGKTVLDSSAKGGDDIEEFDEGQATQSLLGEIAQAFEDPDNIPSRNGEDRAAALRTELARIERLRLSSNAEVLELVKVCTESVDNEHEFFDLVLEQLQELLDSFDEGGDTGGGDDTTGGGDDTTGGGDDTTGGGDTTGGVGETGGSGSPGDNDRGDLPPCLFCGEKGPLEDMMFCAMPGCDKTMHYRDVGLTAMPSIYLPQLCPDCDKEKPGPTPRMSAAAEQELRNFVNLGQSCYTSAPLALFLHLDMVHDFLMNEENEKAKPDSESGRTPEHWLPTSYRIQRQSTVPGAITRQSDLTTPEQVKTWSAQHMQNATNMYRELRTLFGRMSDKGEHISAREMRRFFATVHDLDWMEFFHDTQNDAAVLFVTLLEALILVTETSTSAEFQTWSSQITQSDGPGLPAVGIDATRRFMAEIQHGKASMLYRLFCVQIATEYFCGSCQVVHRTFSYPMYLELNFTSTGDHDLVEMIQEWSIDFLDAENKQACLHDDRKTGADTRQKRITHAPHYLMVKFMRGNDAYLNHVDVPEFLNIAECANNVTLPSESRYGILAGTRVDCIYRLAGVVMFKNGHFTAHIVKHGHWVKFDDLAQSTPERQHPQAAINEGAIVYFAVYQQQSGQKSFPYDLTNESSCGFVLKKRTDVPSTAVSQPRWSRGDKFRCPHPASPCEETFDLAQQAEEHAKQSHPAKDHPVFTCPLDSCLESFDTEVLLSSHLETVHRYHGTLRCEKCGYQAATPDDLQHHSRKHEGAPPTAQEELAKTEKALAEARAKLAATIEDTRVVEKQKAQAEKARDAALAAENAQQRTLLEREKDFNNGLILRLRTHMASLQGQVEALQSRNAEIDEQLDEMQIA